MRVQERPHELAADIFEAKFKVRVLIHGVVAAKICTRSDGHALLVGYLFGLDQSSRIARSRGGNRGVKRMRERVSQCDARSAGLHLKVR
jgi:hypothetical protein